MLPSSSGSGAIVGRRIELSGTVQGVGLRPWLYRLACTTGVTGHVFNGAAGVTVDAFASASTLDVFLERLRRDAPTPAHIDGLTWSPIASGPVPPREFSIVGSDPSGARRASIPPDLATCDACLAEVLDPANRRYRYPFTSCTACGPRFTIARNIPYDRGRTTMARFPMCRACLDEYDSAGDRRFHTQANACPRCGPVLRLEAPNGERIEGQGDALAKAARLLLDGRIVAIKGLGGWHLACDATSESAVAELRRRKRRDEKAFAVMVVDETAADRLAILAPVDRDLLRSVERPIVLVPRRGDAPVADGVAPDSIRLGLMLPYTPLHHLLLRDVDRPIVMTSGNASGEPIACDDDDARRRLGGIADALLVHDRAIATRADDSVAMSCAGRATIVRRSRGFVPRAVRTRRPFHRPILACGAHLKNAFCIASADCAYLSPHVGDLEELETYGAYVDAIARMERFLGVRPEVIAHDMHPRYLSTRFATREREGLERVAVQHHHAHAASAMAEHGLAGPVLAVVFDGAGLGTDGTSWGGEILCAEYSRFERIARLRPFPLPGAEQAVRETWRTALALLDDAYEGDPPIARLDVFSGIMPHAFSTMRRMIAAGINAPLSSGLGRYFDAMGAVGLGRTRATYEGQVAMAWADVADVRERRSYPFAIDVDTTPWSIDLRATVRAAVDDLLSGLGPATVSARFHESVIRASTEVVTLAATRRGALPVVLSGGCFQNVRLAEGISRELATASAVYVHAQVPPGDGGIALGQAVVADAIVRGEV
jgi:hydrogenase maturation protein HypF